MTAWKPEMKVNGKWYDNALRFATKEEAEQSAFNLFMRWTTPEEYRATECDDPVNYRMVDGRQEHIPEEKETAS